MDKYEVIVVGAGNSGMAAAATCAKFGKKTLLLERHNIIGGSTQSFRRGRFEYEASLHELAGIGTKEQPGPLLQIFNALGADIDWRAEKNLYRVIAEGEKGYDVQLPAGPKNLIAKMEELYGCGEKVAEIFQLVGKAFATEDYMKSGKMDPVVLMNDHADYMRLASHTAKEAMDAMGIPKEAQHVLNTYWPYYGTTPDTQDALSFFKMIWFYTTFYPQMPADKSPEIAYALAKVVTDNGGEIWTNTEVKTFMVKDDTVYGVVLADGREIQADYVISNWYPNSVIASLKPEQVPERSLKMANAREVALSFVTIYLGLNKTKEELGINDYSVFWYSDVDENKVLRRSFGYGGEGWIIGNCLNEVIPESSPKGTSTMFFTSAVHGDIWKNVKPEEYNKKKIEVAERILKTYEEKLGLSIIPYIEEIEIATPVTFARYLNTPNGTPYGYTTNLWDSTIARNMNLANEQMFKRLKFCGAASESGDGYSTNLIGGFTNAMQVLEELKEGK